MMKHHCTAVGVLTLASLSAAMAQAPSKWLREPDGFKDLKFGDSMKAAQAKAEARYHASGE